MTPLHPLLERLLRKVEASPDVMPSADGWAVLLSRLDRTLRDADSDRYTAERAMETLSVEMQGLYSELERRTHHEITMLRTSEERHRLLFDANPLPISVVDAETRTFLAVNDAMVRTYGYSREEFLALTVDALALPDELDMMIAGIQDASPDAIRRVGVRRHRCKGGAIVDMDLTVHRIAFEDRPAMLAIGLDTTRARQLEEELRQAQKLEAIGQLAGGVAHDFNNILAVILTNAEFGLDDVAPDDPSYELLTEIRDAATRGASLTRKLLTFSRKQKRQARPLVLDTVIADLKGMLARVVGERFCIKAETCGDSGTIEADRGEIEQVLMNLVVNARDAMEQGGDLVIATRHVTVDAITALHLGIEAGNFVTLLVTDTGCGMTPEVQARIFEPFFTTKAVDRGTGLGLATVFGIVKQSHGAITVTSEVGRGTTFEIYFPRVDAVPELEHDNEVIAPLGFGNVLLVEDSTPLRHVLRKFLTSWGYTVVEAANGIEALEIVDQGHVLIDLLLTDFVMPHMDGRTLSRRILERQPHLHVLFMSGHPEHASLEEALGPDEFFLQKPFSAKLFAETLRRVIDATIEVPVVMASA
ncbi:MAG: response regulator [Kofleriaceae bacterium]